MSPISVLYITIFSYLSVSYVVADTSKITALAAKCNAVQEDMNVILKYQVPETSTGKCLMQCMLKELNMLTSEEKYDEALGIVAFRNFWAGIDEKTLQQVNTHCANFAKTIESEPSKCEYGFKIMKCINAEFYRLKLLSEKKST